MKINTNRLKGKKKEIYLERRKDINKRRKNK